MKKEFWSKIITAMFVIVIFSGFFSGNDDVYLKISKNIDLFTRIYKEIALSYVDDVDPEEFMKAGINGMLQTLDPYTVFIDEDKKEDIDLMTNGKYGGVGISIGVRGDDVTVTEVMDGYSAQRQGIRVGDILIKAADKKISSENVDDISSLVKGEPGTTVQIEITRNEKKDTLIFNLIREEVILKNLTYSGFFPENSGNVYLKLSNFSRTAADEIKSAIKQLSAQKNIESIVLDLRGNPGGLLDVAVDICDKFLQKDLLIVTTKGREEFAEKKYFSEQEPIADDPKLVVLIDGGSASASEIVAGAIQDHDRGIIVGTKSFGKGLVQTISPIGINTSLKITTAKYYTPSGRCIQKIDYSNKNDDKLNENKFNAEAFTTDNNRTVFSAGGITPDSTVEFQIQGGITKDLLAKGLFFQFADAYYYAHTDQKFDNLQPKTLLKDFGKYLSEQDYLYHSDTEKQIDKIISEMNKAELDKQTENDLRKIQERIAKVDEESFKKYESEILLEIKSELGVRYLGASEKVKMMLEVDPQFQTAYRILNSQNLYKKLLHSN
ncbi:MAG: S41 family peptidase [Ignavibacteriales bacterium]|nr:S41 family peptidase [Ignavibacteriales bacterium]